MHTHVYLMKISLSSGVNLWIVVGKVEKGQWTIVSVLNWNYNITYILWLHLG